MGRLRAQRLRCERGNGADPVSPRAGASGGHRRADAGRPARQAERDAGPARRVEQHLEGCPTCPPLYAALVGATDALAGRVVRHVTPTTSSHPTTPRALWATSCRASYPRRPSPEPADGTRVTSRCCRGLVAAERGGTVEQEVGVGAGRPAPLPPRRPRADAPQLNALLLEPMLGGRRTPLDPAGKGPATAWPSNASPTSSALRR